MFIVNKAKQCCGADCTAYFVMLLGANGWVFAIVLGTTDSRINIFNMGFVRGVMTTVISYIILRAYGLSMDFRKDLWNMNIRNLVMTLHGVANTGAALFLELPLVFTIFNTGPALVFVVDYFVTGSQISRKQAIGIVICSFGDTGCQLESYRPLVGYPLRPPLHV